MAGRVGQRRGADDLHLQVRAVAVDGQAQDPSRLAEEAYLANFHVLGVSHGNRGDRWFFVICH